jgi:protein-S-isoprenylcysteine O-methyltransferase Ste14
MTGDYRPSTNQLPHFLQPLGWLACVVYSTIPAFWLMIHPFAERWRTKSRSPYVVLVPTWIAIWAVVALIASPWRNLSLYGAGWSWALAAPLFVVGIYIYVQSGESFTVKQLGGLPEVHSGNRDQRLVTDGIRARVRHPMYLGHLCEMLAWSIGTGLAVSWGLTAVTILTGAIMIRTEEDELEKRFGEQYLEYRKSVPAIVPRLGKAPSYNPH